MLPCSLGGEFEFNKDTYEEYKTTWSKADKSAPMLFHSRTGIRAGKPFFNNYSYLKLRLITEGLIHYIGIFKDKPYITFQYDKLKAQYTC